MAIRNQEWYNLNETRDYPLSDNASALSNAGIRIPQGIISDIKIRWPSWAGKYAFLGSVSVTSGAVSVTVLSSQDLSNTGESYVPILALSVPLAELESYRQYAFESQYPGAFGYLVFGEGLLNNYTGLFSSPEQSLLTSRSARPHGGLPVTGLSKSYDQTPLTGLVNLSSQDPLSITKGTRYISGADREAIIFSLVEQTDNIDNDNFVSVFETFAGNCGKRPESENCGDPQPLTRVNEVSPCCDGSVTLDFRGCSVVGKNIDDGSVVLECTLGINDTCEPPFIPTIEGVLPSEKEPVIEPVPPQPEPTPTPTESLSEVPVISIALPYCENFNDQEASYFSTVLGEFSFSEIDEADSPEDPCSDASQSESDSEATSYNFSTDNGGGRYARSLAVWTPDAQTYFREYETAVQITANGGATGLNGGIGFNYRVNGSGASQFWIAELNLTSTNPGRFRLVYFNGLTFVELVWQDIYGLVVGDWYKIRVKVIPQITTVDVTCYLDGITDSGLSVTLGPYGITSNDYSPDSALAGLHSNQSSTMFSYWKVNEKLS